jgi:tetratricopeptide (TPR) repeat protein
MVLWPALWGQYLWDDPAHITRPELRSLVGLGRILFEIGATQEYYPVLHGAFWVEYRLWGDSPLGYHMCNVLLHATNCCLLAFVLRQLWDLLAMDESSAAARSSIPRGIEWLAALLFAVHPVCVESVAWITEQKNTLSTALYLVAAFYYLRFAAQRRPLFYGLALAAFVLALGAKTMTVTLPAALLVVLWWKNGRLAWKRDVLPLVPWFLAAFIAGLVTSHVERNWVGAQGGDYELTLWQRPLLAAHVFWFFLAKLLWPVDVTFFYPRWDVAAQAPSWTGYLIAAGLVTALLWRLRNRSRGPLAAWLLYLGTLFPVLGFFNVFAFSFSYVADHFQYLAIPIVLSSVAIGFSWALLRLDKTMRLVASVALGALITVLGLASHRQSALYRDDETLFRANIASNPTSWMGHQILATTLLKKSPENYDEAVRLYRRALELKPNNPDSLYKLGYALAQRPETHAEALDHYRAALRLRPTFVEAHNSLGFELAAMPGKLPEAIDHYREAIKLRPDFVYARINLAHALAQSPDGRVEAIHQLEEVLRRFPNDAAAHYDLANILATQPGREGEAEAHYEAALGGESAGAEMHARFAGFLLQRPGRAADALNHFETAVRLQPDSVEFQTLLANALAGLRRLPEATTHFEAALRLAPNSAASHYNLANALVFQPARLKDAIEHYDAAYRLKPDSADICGNLANALALQPDRMREAFAFYEAALTLDPARADVHYNYALHLADTAERESDALTHATEAVRLKPDYVEARNLFGVLHARANRPDEAKAQWMEALRLNPQFTPARENLQMIERADSR